MTVDRRTFLGLALSGFAGACASLVTTPVTPVDGTIRLVLAHFPTLTQPNGFARLRAPDARMIYVLALADGSYAAVSPICKHQGCTVEIEHDRLSCPCHGSQYSREGRVLRGPTQAPLDRYATSIAGGTLIIDLRTAHA